MTTARPFVPATAGLAVAILALTAARGIRWDENYEFAQVILGHVSPPAGHPLTLYATNAFSAQTYLAALLLALTGSPSIVCGIRNILFLMATLVPVFLFTAKLARCNEREDFAAASAAAVLILFGVHLEYDGAYPQFVWPDMFSNGHIGAACALIAVYLFTNGHIRSASLLLGLMPCIHIGQMPPVALFGALVYGWRAKAGGIRGMRPAVYSLAAGLAVCVLFGVIRRPFLVQPPVDGPYCVPGDPWPIWKGFVAVHDIHRAIPVGNIWLIVAGLPVFAALAAWIYRNTPQVKLWRWTFAYAVIIAAIVVPIAAIHAVMRAEIPPILLQWMPYRLLNHLPVLLVAVVCAILARNSSGRWLLAGTMVLCIVSPALEYFLPAALYTRYLTPSAGILFFLAGAGFSLLWTEHPPAGRLQGLIPLLGTAIAPFHLFGSVCWILGGYAACALTLVRPMRVPIWGALAAAAILLVGQQLHARQSLPVPRYAVQIRDALRDTPGAVLLAPPDQLLLQAHTGHPVLSDMALPFMIAYLPRIAPAIEQMYNEVYGISFLPSPKRPLSGDMRAWQLKWPAMSPQQWRGLAGVYGFDCVVAPRGIPLTLPVMLDTGAVTVYRAR